MQCSNYSIATHKRFRKVVDQHSLLLCTAIALLLSVRWPTAMRMEMSELLQWIYIYIYVMYIWLVVSTPLKNIKVSWDDYSQYMEK